MDARALADARQRPDAFARRRAPAGGGVVVGDAVFVFPAQRPPLDHAAIAWPRESGLPAPPPTRLGAELVVTTTGIDDATFPVPYVWWRAWTDVVCTMAAVGRPRWANAKALMDDAVRHRAVATREPGP